MSTKIYTGFRFRNPDMITIRKQLIEFQASVEEVSTEAFVRLLAKLATEIIDARTLGVRSFKDAYPEVPPASCASRVIRDRMQEIKKTGLRDREVDFSFEVCVFPLSRKKTLGIYYADLKGFEKLIQRQSWFLDYHYQNSTDKPPRISSSEWCTRRKDWDKALSVNDIPAHSGFTMDVSSSYLPFYRLDPPELLAQIPSFDLRVQSAVLYFFPGKRFKSKLSEEDKKSGFAILEELRTFRESSAGKKVLEQAEKKVRSKLKRRLSGKDLYGAQKKRRK